MACTVVYVDACRVCELRFLERFDEESLQELVLVVDT